MQASSADEAFTKGADQGQNNASGNVETMLDFNALQYEMFPDLSVCTERTMKNAYFQRDTYDSNTTAYCVLNSGSDFIDGRNSYFIFELEASIEGTPNGTEILSWGKAGSAYNIIRRIILTDRAGNELERIENVNRLVALNQNTCNSEDWFNNYATQFNISREEYDSQYSDIGTAITTTPTAVSIDTSAGTTVFTGDPNAFASYVNKLNETVVVTTGGVEVLVGRIVSVESSNAPTASDDILTVEGIITSYSDPINVPDSIDLYSSLLNSTTADVNKKVWLLPLRWMSGIFDYEQLLPSQLMSGLRIEIQFETANKAFIRTNASAGGVKYKIKNPRIALDSCKLTDAIQRELNERSANDGLEIVYRTWWSTESVVNTDQINLESRKAVSRAFRALTCIYDKEDQLSQSMVPAKFDYVRYQYRAGNLYFPNQPVSSNLPDSGTATQQLDVLMEAFNHTQKMFAKNKELWWDSSQSISDWTWESFPYATLNQAGDANAGFAVLVADLERTTVQDLSGIPLNNSRVLALQARLKNAAQDKPIIMFMQYLKIARIFLDNTEVEE